MTLSAFHIIGIILFIAAALMLIAMMITRRSTRMGRHQHLASMLILAIIPATAAAINDGTFYLYNLGAQRYMNFGGDDGYTAAFLDYGTPLSVTNVEGGYNIGNTHYDSGACLNANGKGKSTASVFIITETAEGAGVYTIKSDNGFFGYDSSLESTLQSGTTVAYNLTDDGSDNVHWQLLTKAELEARLAGASPEHPIDATFYIAAPGMNRHEVGLNTAWTLTNCKKSELYYNPNQAIWHTSPSSGETCSVSQTLTALKPGKYRLTCQGFYRAGTNTNAYNDYTNGTHANNAIIYACNQICKLLPIYVDGQSTSEIYDAAKADNSAWTWANSTKKGELYYPYFSSGNQYPSSSACVAFDHNLYTARDGYNTVVFTVGVGESIEIGAMTLAAVAYDWMAVDNFRLAYLGTDFPTEGDENIDVTMSIENTAISKFLRECGYDDDATTSVVQRYTGYHGRNDQPLSYGFYMTDGVRYEVKNMIPGETYTIDVTDGNGKHFAGKVTAKETGFVRMIDAGNIINVRDLGGWIVADGRRIRYGLIYRGGQMNGQYATATPQDIQTLKDLGIGAEIDLRWYDGYDKDDQVGISAFGFTEGEGTLYAARANDYKAEDLKNAETHARLKAEFQFILGHIKNGRAVYFHCAWGADRTGLLSFLLEGVLGQTIGNIYRNYELTSFSAAGSRLFPSFKDRIKVITDLEGRTLRDKFENYFTNSLGVSKADIEEFRTLMLFQPEHNFALSDQRTKEGLLKYICQDEDCGEYDRHHFRIANCISDRSVELSYDGETYSTTEALEIQDGEAFSSPVPFEAECVTYKRYYYEGVWSAWYVPFEVDASYLATQGFTAAYIEGIHTYDDDRDGTLDRTVMEVVKITNGRLFAGTPYLVRADEGYATELVNTGVTLKSDADVRTVETSTATARYDFVGTYTGLTADEVNANGQIFSLDSEGKMVHRTGRILPQRWYCSTTYKPSMYGQEAPPPLLARSIITHVIGEEDQATGIRTIYPLEQQVMEKADTSIFGLDGIKLSVPQHGKINIINGKKQFVK